MIAIIDYGVGNVGSILNMFRKIGHEANLVSSENALLEASAIVLPGVGAFDRGMKNLDESGLVPALTKAVLDDRRPLLGVCLGMQLLTRGSEEGQRPGLGWIEGSTHRFSPPDQKLKVPHMGWNRVTPVKESPLLAGIEDPRFYFLHSYYVKCEDRSQTLCTTVYGEPFDSGVHHDNVYGVQFHPEKSHRLGMKVFRNFAALSA